MGMFHNKNSVFVFVCPQTRLQSGLVFSNWTLYSSVTFDLADCDSVYVWSQNHTLLFELSKFVLGQFPGDALFFLKYDMDGKARPSEENFKKMKSQAGEF